MDETDSPEQPSLSFVLDEYHYRLDAGEAVSPEELMERYPHLAPQLAAYFQEHRSMYAAMQEEMCHASSAARWSLNTLSRGMSRPGGPHVPSVSDLYHVDADLGETADARYFRVHGREPDGKDLILAIGKWPQWGGQEGTARLLAAGNRLTDVKHQHLHPFRGLAEREGHLFAVCDFVQCPTLSQHLAIQPLPWQSAIRLCLQIAAAVAALHARQIAHGNIHPDHVLMTSPDSVLLTSYGLPQLGFDWGTLPPEMTCPCRTLTFTAPELLPTTGNTGPTSAGDVYSLGALLNCLLDPCCRVRPVERGSRSASSMREGEVTCEVNDAIPDALARICRRAMATAAAERTAGAGEFAKQLSALIDTSDFRG